MRLRSASCLDDVSPLGCGVQRGSVATFFHAHQCEIGELDLVHRLVDGHGGGCELSGGE